MLVPSGLAPSRRPSPAAAYGRPPRLRPRSRRAPLATSRGRHLGQCHLALRPKLTFGTCVRLPFMSSEKLTKHAVILAGGRGTRFWPRSRTRTPKQLLNIVGDTTMLEQTVARLLPLIPAARKRVRVEPVGVNTAAAIGLAAVHIREAAGSDALMAVLPSDHFIGDAEKYRRIVRAALTVAADPGRMVVLGIPPTRPETGFGYVERLAGAQEPPIEQPFPELGFPVFAVRRFTEKPKYDVAERYAASGNHYWNAGMFFWRASTYLQNLERFLPKTRAALESLAAFIGKRNYGRRLRAIYPQLENISVDYAILEPATRQTADSGPAGTKSAIEKASVFVIPAEVGWSDIGSWAAVYELLAKTPAENVLAGPGQTIDAAGNFFYSPKKFVAAIGVRDLVVVDTPDALLIVPRHRAQDVAALVKLLEQQKRAKLL